MPCPAPSTGGTPGGSRPPVLPRGAGGWPNSAGFGSASYHEWKETGGSGDDVGVVCCGGRHDGGQVPFVGGAFVR